MNGVEPQQVDILGVRVSAIDIPFAVACIQRWFDSGVHNFVCVTGVHGVMESYRDARLREIHNTAGLVTPDGMPLVWLARMMGITRIERVYGPDLMLAICEWSVGSGCSHFFYGGAAGVPERLAEELADRFPGLKIAGTYSPPFRDLTPEEDELVIEKINHSGAGLVWVGISTPKQERWMSSHVSKLNASALIGVGAAFDIHSGLKPQAPMWMRDSGLEWLFRLAVEPKRLWKRYAINNPLFIALAARQFLSRRSP